MLCGAALCGAFLILIKPQGPTIALSFRVTYIACWYVNISFAYIAPQAARHQYDCGVRNHGSRNEARNGSEAPWYSYCTSYLLVTSFSIHSHPDTFSVLRCRSVTHNTPSYTILHAHLILLSTAMPIISPQYSIGSPSGLHPISSRNYELTLP